MRFRRRRLALAAVALALAVTLLGPHSNAQAAGSVTLTVPSGAYAQDFNTLASTGTANTAVPTGWDFFETGTGANTAYSAGTGSSTTGDTYSFGASGSTDRAFGTLLSTTLNPVIGVQFTNTTGSPIQALAISYTGEQWRLGQNTAGRAADRLDFQLSTNATSLGTGTWVDHNALDFLSPVTAGTVGALNGNAAPNRTTLTYTITGLNIPNGGTFWLRWVDSDLAPGSDDGLAVDDFSLTPYTSPTDIAPTITNVSPSSGPTVGGTSVIITGSGFTAATAVKFGSTMAGGYAVDSDTQITATAPAGSAGTVNITVTTAGGTSATGSTDRFTYVAAPTVTGVAPDLGPTTGGTSVVITGTGFSGATAVRFGSKAASYTVNSSTRITATSPAGGPGTVDVRVTAVEGTSSTSSADYFTYVPAPTIESIVPSIGSVDGGEIVTVHGTNFDAVSNTAVSFGGTAATVTDVTGSSITVSTPARDLGGTVDVVVTTAGGSATASMAYTYVGSLNLLSPSIGDFASVTLSGFDQTTNASMGTFTVSDSRGSGGWNVTVQASQFTCGSHTLPLGSISMPQPGVSKGTPQSTGLPTLVAGPYLIGGVSPIKIASAANDGSGEGTYIFNPEPLTLTVPADTYAGAYTSTITVSVISGP